MTTKVVRHALRIVLVFLLSSLATLLFLDILPGDTALAVAGENATPEVVAAVKHDLGLDRPFLTRYADWVSGVVTGDLGRSVRTQQPVKDVIVERFPVTLELAALSFILALLIAIPLGVHSAYRAGGVLDRIATVISSFFLSLPSFLSSIFLVLVFAVAFRVFPVTGWTPFEQDPLDNLYHIALPVLALALPEAASFTRLLRNDMAGTLEESYIVAARARGLPPRRILFGHALRPSSFTLVTVAGVTFARLLGGAIIVESIFALPGLGQEAVQAILQNDFIAVRGVVVVASVSYLLINALVDLCYPLLDPRARSEA